MDNNYMKTYKTSRGSGLLEVLVAVLVLSIGMLSIARLHSTLIKEGSSANNRAIAVKLAQTRLDQLRQFRYTGPDPSRAINPNCSQRTALVNGAQVNVSCFTSIAAEANAQAVAFANIDSNTNFSWQITAVNGNNIQKDVTVTVTWTDANGAQAVNLSSTIFAMSSEAQAIGDGSGVGAMSDGPSVLHNPGITPDVVPIFVTGNKVREAQKPEPDINQSGINTITKFSVANYDSVSNRLLQNEEFVTVNCTCVQSGVVANQKGREPSTDSKNIGALVDKRKGVAKTGGQFNQQPAVCTVCCNDHHDGLSPARLYDPFRPLADYLAGSGDHNHYLNLASANAVGNEYDEACRLIRINGLWYASTDWNLAAIVVAPKQYFESNLSSYQNQVALFVKDYINAIGAGYPTTLPNLTFTLSPALPASYNIGSTTAAAPLELMARGIYIDHMTPEQIAKFKESFGNGARPILDGVPFQEVNITRLATWSTNNPSIATVSNDAITDQSEASYTRGKVIKGNTAGETLITATIKKSNTGLTASRPLDAHDQVTSQAQVAVTTTGGTPVVNQYLWGVFDFGPNSTGVSASNISTPMASNGMLCTVLTRNQTVPATGAACGSNDGCYSCITGNSSWTGTLSIEVVTINSQFGTGYCVSPTATATSSQTIPINNNRTEYKAVLNFGNYSLADEATTSVRQNITFRNCP